MASAGTVTVDFSAETAKFTAELKKVRNELSLVRKDTKLVSDTISQAKQLIAGYLTIGSAVSAVRAVVQATSEAEHAQALLNNALAAAKVPVKAASAELSAYAGQLQRTTTFSDEAVMQVETLLLSFQGLSSDTIKRATANVLDLSTRMGIDAPSAAKLLGKALADPEKGITQLARSGVIFTDQQKEQIKTLVASGESLKAQDYILKQLEQTFGGAASAARNTFGGAISGLKNAVGELLEGKGGVNDASEAINGLTASISSPEFQTAAARVISFLVNTIDLAAKAASGLATIFTGSGINPGGIQGTDTKDDIIREYHRQIATLRANSEMDSAEMRSIKDRMIAEIEEKIRRLGEKHESARGRKPGAVNFVTGGEDQDTGPSPAAVKAAEERKRQKQQELEDIIALELNIQGINAQSETAEAERLARETELRRQAQKQELEDIIALEQNINDINAQSAEERARQERDLQDRVTALRQGALNSGLGFLSALAARSKTAAKAMIVVQKGLAIASVIQNTAAAVTRTLAIYGGTPFGYAAAASVKAIGAAQIGLIAATGALEISNVGAGGGSFGTASPNATNQRDSEDASQPGASSQASVQVNITGVVTPEILDQLWDGLSDLANGRDKILFNVNSRQAQEIRAGG